MAEVSNSKLFQIDTGILQKDACIVIVKTEWNSAVVDELENGAIKMLKEYGITDIRTIVVPGAFEIPFGVKAYWDNNKHKSNRPCAIITFGCVLRGDTPHFEYVCRAVTDGVLQLNLQLPVPVIFGVLTVDNQLQADERIGGRHGHKGEEAAITAVKMIALNNSFKK